MLRHDEETYAIEVDARGPARSPQIIDQRFVDRLFNEVSHPTMNLDSPNFQPPYVFISIDPNTGRLIDRNAPSFSNYALVSFYSVPGGPYVLLGAEDIDCGDVNQYLPKIIDHVKRLYNLPALRYSKFVVITENRTGHESTRLREDFVRCGFQNMYMLQLGINMRQGIPMNEEIKRSCIFNLASVFENDRLYFDRDFFSVHAETLHADVLGSLTPAMFVKREMKKQFENFRAVRKASTEIGVEPRIKYTGKISPNSRDDIFMATAIGMYYASMFERDDRFENLRI